MARKGQGSGAKSNRPRDVTVVGNDIVGTDYLFPLTRERSEKVPPHSWIHFGVREGVELGGNEGSDNDQVVENQLNPGEGLPISSLRLEHEVQDREITPGKAG